MFGAQQARDELRRQCALLRARLDGAGVAPAGALLMMPCAARGAQLFGEPDVEEDIVRDVLGAPEQPLGVFFRRRRARPVRAEDVRAHLHELDGHLARARGAWR